MPAAQLPNPDSLMPAAQKYLKFGQNGNRT